MLSKVNKNKSTPRHSVLKLQNMKDNETIRKVIVLVCLGSSYTTRQHGYEKQTFIFQSGKCEVRRLEVMGQGARMAG